MMQLKGRDKYHMFNHFLCVTLALKRAKLFIYTF